MKYKFGKHLLYGLSIILGGLFIYMTLALFVGYLAYSDRPGTGWLEGNVTISWSQINMIFGFILFLGIYILGKLILIYGLFKLFTLIGFNLIAYSILGGIIIGFLSAYLTLGIGWYIALDSTSVIVAGILGIIYGSTIFPRFFINYNRETST